MSTTQNLDRLAAQHAQKLIVKAKEAKDAPGDMDNAVTKTLGVLQENGIYAACLFLLSRPQREQDRARMIVHQMLAILCDLPFDWQMPPNEKADTVLAFITDTVTKGEGAQGTQRLVLAKETLEQMLIYARYSAKAWGQEAKKQKAQDAAQSSAGG